MQKPDGLPFVFELPAMAFRPYMYSFEVNLLRRYQVVVIEHDYEFGVGRKSAEGQKILKLARRGREAFIKSAKEVIGKKFADEYGENDLKRMRQSDRIDGLHSSRILVLEAGRPIEQAEVLGGLRLVADGDNLYGLDLEDSIDNYTYKRDWRFVVNFSTRINDGQLGAMAPLLEGGTIQLTGFFNNGEPEIGAILNFVASEISLRRPESMPLVRLTQKMKDEYRIVTKGLIEAPEYVRLWPAEFVAYCDRELAEKYYIPIMKFRNVNPDGGPVSGRTYVVRSPISHFAVVAEQNFLYRKGLRGIEENGLTRHWSNSQENPRENSLHYDVQYKQVAPLNNTWTPLHPWALPASPRIWPRAEPRLDGLAPVGACRQAFGFVPRLQSNPLLD